ncbi:MarR family winged helix-turn-helix transcriptional regulator [Mycolicibacterium pulveris]|uniref:MarR family winged helix-turn-helix transcriptional regulator n=1 Tax=Mycolicibacterium pulveris TaxID=36813 RepID=UPI003CF40A3F
MEPSDDALRSWERFREAASLLYQKIDTALTTKHHLTVPDLRILHRLHTDPHGCVRMGALAETLLLAPSRATWQVRRLEERGLVQRGRRREDKRIVIVGITRKGEEHLLPALRTYSALVRRYYLDPLTREQMIALGDSTRRVSDALKLREMLPRS